MSYFFGSMGKVQKKHLDGGMLQPFTGAVTDEVLPVVCSSSGQTGERNIHALSVQSPKFSSDSGSGHILHVEL